MSDKLDQGVGRVVLNLSGKETVALYDIVLTHIDVKPDESPTTEQLESVAEKLRRQI